MVWSHPMTIWNTVQFMCIEYPNSDKLTLKKLAIKLSKNKTVSGDGNGGTSSCIEITPIH